MDVKLIVANRKDGEDASAVAAAAAKDAGTKLRGKLRWYGAAGPAYREIDTADGRTVRVTEEL